MSLKQPHPTSFWMLVQRKLSSYAKKTIGIDQTCNPVFMKSILSPYLNFSQLCCEISTCLLRNSPSN